MGIWVLFDEMRENPASASFRTGESAIDWPLSRTPRADHGIM